MANYETAFLFMQENEDDPRKPGKVTRDNDRGMVRFGLNSNSNPDLLARGFYSMPTLEALALARDVYRERYWVPIWGDDLKSQRVANKLLDMSVNMGPVQAIKLAQRVPGVWNKDLALSVDGKMGPKSLAAINATDEDQMVTGLRKEWKIFIGKVIEVKPQYAELKDEWEARAEQQANA